MRSIAVFCIFIFLLVGNAIALTQKELKTLQDSVKEMCLFPDRTAEYLKVEGNAKAGLPVAVKIVKGELSGNISYGTWTGIPVTLDKYKTDPRQCAQEMMRILVPAFSTKAKPNSISPKAVQTDLAGTGGPGGSGTIIGSGGTIIGGKGGDAGVSGVGGKGGDGFISGDNGLIIGGDGGNAGTPDGRGGRRTQGPTEKPNFPTSEWPFGYGGAGANAPEYDRRLQVLIKIRSEYKKAFPGDVIFIKAGIDQVPLRWINKRLEELGEKWRIDKMNDGGYEMPPLTPENRSAASATVTEK